MHITHSAIQLQSSHHLLEYQQQRESLNVWREGPEGRQTLSMESSQERLHISHGQHQFGLQLGATLPTQAQDNDFPARMRALLPADPASINAPAVNEVIDEEAETLETPLDLKTAMLKMFVERLIGRKVELFDPAELRHKETPEIIELRSANPDNTRSGMRYEFEQTTIEVEKTQFSAKGIVHTADGREIHLDLQLSMSREYYEQTRLRIQIGNGQLKDPLVINFSGHAAELTQTRYAFDIDANGKMDEIPFVGPGSGFLALDRNQDGQINDGSELFGAISGNGFAELARYDEDGNGWIDANDSVFSRLLIWSKDAQGNDQLSSLQDKNIGAIYLRHADTPFALRDSQNQALGQVRSSGIHLNTQGLPGSVQQLDLLI